MEDFVTFEQAKCLEKLGFDWECNHFYPTVKPNKLFRMPLYHNKDDVYEAVLAPTLAQAQKWLREKEIEVGVYGDFDGELRTEKWVWLMRKFNTHLFDTIFTEHDISYDTYEEALSEGINKALELLKEENK